MCSNAVKIVVQLLDVLYQAILSNSSLQSSSILPNALAQILTHTSLPPVYAKLISQVRDSHPGYADHLNPVEFISATIQSLMKSKE
jgi:hypothetical protein